MVMDSTVIQEIANQLGMAVDQAGQFIQEQLPNYAALKVMQFSVPTCVIIILTILALIVYCISSAIAAKDYKERKEDWINAEKSYWLHYPSYHESVVGMVSCGSLVCFTVLLALTICCLIFILPEIIGWSEYPEAMLIDIRHNDGLGNN